MGRTVYAGWGQNCSIIIICMQDVLNPDTKKMSIDEYVIILRRNMYVKRLYSHSKGKKFYELVKLKFNLIKVPHFYFFHVDSLGKELYNNVRGILYIDQNVSKLETQCFYTETDNSITVYWNQWRSRYLCWSLNYHNWESAKSLR